MRERLQKILSARGVASRRSAETLLKAGASSLISRFSSIPALLSRLSVLRMAA